MSKPYPCPSCGGAALLETGASYGMEVITCQNALCGLQTLRNWQTDSKANKNDAWIETPHGWQEVVPPAREIVQQKLGIDPGPPTTKIKLKEETVQAQTIQALTLRGYVVLQTTVRYKWQKCPSCHRGHAIQGGYGATPGVPDLLVSHPDWAQYGGPQWVGLEMKGTDTPLSAEQEALQGRGLIFVSRSMEESLHIIERVAQRLALEPSRAA